MKISESCSRLGKSIPVVVIVVVAAFLRFYRLAEVPPGLHPDEAMNGINALEAWRSGHFQVFYPENGGREGLFINTQSLALGLIGRNEPWVLRLVSAIFGTMTVLAFYFFCRELSDKTTAQLASLLMATNVWHITMSRFGTRPVSALFFLLWGLYLFWRSARSLADGSRWHILEAVAAGVVYGLGFHTYTAYRITPLMVAALLPPMTRQYGLRNAAKVGTIAAIVASTTALPLALYFLRHRADFTQRISEVSLLSSSHPIHQLLSNTAKTMGMYAFAGDENWRHNLSGQRMLFWPVAILCGGGVVLATFRQRWLLAFWAAGMLPAVLSTEAVPHALRTSLTIPAALFAAALGGTWVWRRIAPTLPSVGTKLLPYIAGSALLVQAYHAYFVEWGQNPTVAAWFYDDAVAHARSLLAAPRDIPKYVVFSEEAGRYDRGLPSSARPIMFLTDTFSPERQQELRVQYLLLNQTNQIARGWVYVDFIPPPTAY
jgi:4-amino-4-deoxy-L-arabinose transferase-like glycosyltransferase